MRDVMRQAAGRAPLVCPGAHRQRRNTDREESTIDMGIGRDRRRPQRTRV